VTQTRDRNRASWFPPLASDVPMYLSWQQSLSGTGSIQCCLALLGSSQTRNGWIAAGTPRLCRVCGRVYSLLAPTIRSG